MTYTRWGATSCPGGASFLYEGFMAGAKFDHSGGGANFLCMHPQPQLPPGASSESNGGGRLFGTEYENSGTLDLNQHQDAACAVCQAPASVAVYVQWGRQTCSNGHVTQYAGLVMGSDRNHHKTEHVCVDYSRAVHSTSSSSRQSAARIYTTEMKGGAANEVQYPVHTEVGCAVCSVPENNGPKGTVYPRWGATSCPSGRTKLYGGFIASGKWDAAGSGANFLCMHSSAQAPSGASSSSNGGNWLYGTEYADTGTLDVNSHQDAACAMCQLQQSSYIQTYVQWGRQVCGNGHITEYKGLIMGSHYQHKKSEHLCVDYARATHSASSASTEGAARLYTTEVKQGAANNDQYISDKEVGCAVCAVSEEQGAVYPRWGARSCPGGASLLYEGFMAGAKFDHTGSGANFLCMHPQPENPLGVLGRRLFGFTVGFTSNAGNWLYGTEYENSGTIDLNQHQDAACAMCQRQWARQTYVQWGRQTCSDGHTLEYAGVIMGSHHQHKRSEHICVDYDRAVHIASSTTRESAARLYTTEMIAGASDESQYPPNKEVGCAVCSIPSSAPSPPPAAPPPPPGIVREEDCAVRCTARDHVNYLTREAPVFDQWGSSHFVGSTKPALPNATFVFSFHSEKRKLSDASAHCASRGGTLARLNTPEKLAQFKDALASTDNQRLWSNATTTKFTAIFDATFDGKVYDRSRASKEQGVSRILWVHESSGTGTERVTQCGAALAQSAFQQVSTRLSQKHLSDLVGNLIGVNQTSDGSLLPTMCYSDDGHALEFDYENLIGNYPPFTGPQWTGGQRLVRKAGSQGGGATVPAFCYNCHDDYLTNPKRCTSYGETDGLFASGSTDFPNSFNCDELELPYACEVMSFSSEGLQPATCVESDDLVVFPPDNEAARFPTFVKAITFYVGASPLHLHIVCM